MSDIFDENGNAIATTTLTVWGYSGLTGEFTGAYDVRIFAGTGIPGLSTLKPAPSVLEQEVAVYVNDQWTTEPDFREETVYSTATGEPAIVKYIGTVKDGFTLAEPATPYDKWDGSAWVTDDAKRKAANIAEAEVRKAHLRAQADSEIAWRQYAVDRGKATDEEAAALIEWQDYRLDLMRVNPEKPEWPALPGAQAS